MSSRDIADVLIIGSGASGGAFAWYLSKLSGVKIVCLEQGDWVGRPPESPPEADGERSRLLGRPEKREGVRYFIDGYPYDSSESYWSPILGNAVGGATIHYGAVWARLHPSDFKVRSLDGVADDWPISYWDLAPYYDLNDRTVGVSGVPGNPAFPPRSTEFFPPYKLTKAAEVLIRGYRKLGWHWWPSERAVITRPFRGRRPCITNCASCDDGCPREAKNSSDVVHWPEAIRNGVVLRTRSRVREITVNKRGLAEGALYYDAQGRLHEQRARLIILACNGIGTPRLLLNSRSSLFRHGLANSSGLVGKNLRGHTSARVTALFPADNVADADLLTNGIYGDEFYESDPSRGFVRGFRLGSLGYLGPVSAAIDHPSSAATLVPGALRREPILPVAWGMSHRAAFQERVSHTVGVSVSGEELPDESNRVELHETLMDDMGIPAPKLVYKRTENTYRLLDFGMARAKELLLASGAAKILSAELAPGGHHLMGTARMGADPRKSVVDQWGRAHDVKNLFIIDGSVFTTTGAVVPTSTIQAIALRTAAYIKTHSRTLL